MALALKGALALAKEADRRLLQFARTSCHTPAAERAVARFSRLGEHAALWLAIGAVGSLWGRRKRGWRLATAAVATSYLANTAIKFTLRRPRPAFADLPPLTSTPSGLGFPSAHTTTAVVATALYSRLGLPRIPLAGLALAFSYSRLYLGVHYPSDLLGGACLGGMIARIAAPAVLRASSAGR